MREIIEQSKKGQQISTQDLGQSIKAINSSQNIMMNAEDESVDDLLKKLAKKGKKVKLLDEAAELLTPSKAFAREWRRPTAL